MSSTLNRIESGVHSRNDCGSNKNGLSSINSLPDSTNFHILNNMRMSCAPREVNSIPKLKMGASDTLTYMFAKMLEKVDKYNSYVILLRKNTYLCATLQTMVLSCSMNSKIVFIIVPTDSSYNIKSYFKGIETAVPMDSKEKLRKLIVSLNTGQSSMYLVYPELTQDYMDLLNSLKNCSWCVPSSSTHLYVSTTGRQNYSHFVFPWSKSHFSRGYTVGYGPTRAASRREKHLYVGSFGYYENMISGVPYKGVCPDCYEMKRTAINMRKIMGIKEHDSHKRDSTISTSSIVALDEMKKMIDLYCK